MTKLLDTLGRACMAMAVAGALAFGTIGAVTPAESQPLECTECDTKLDPDKFYVECCDAEGSFCHLGSGQCVCA